MRRSAFVAAFAMVASCLVGLVMSPAQAAIAAPTPDNPSPFVGQTVTLSGDLGTPVARPVELQKYSSKKWRKFSSGTSDAAGLYALPASTTASYRDFRVYAKSGTFGGTSYPSVTSATYRLTTQKDTATLSVARVGNNVHASAVASPIVDGRTFTLQVKSGKSWKTVSSPANETAAGAITFAPFPVSGNASYRAVGAAIPGSSGATSNTVSFKPGPASLGRNVLYVTTDNGKTPSKKGVNYSAVATFVSNNAIVPDTDGNLTWDVEEFAVRGNSSARKAKKPYKIKFEKKQKPFGFKADKTWILLANYGDWTLIRSRIAFELGRKQNGLKWTPNEEFSELFVNGSYVGSYQLIESIKIDKNRVNVHKERGAVIEFDPHWKEDGVPGFKGFSGQDFAWKDPDEFKQLDGGGQDPEGLTADKIAKLKTKVTNFEHVLYGTDKKKDWSKIDFSTLDPADDWTTYLDMNSAVDYYLTREFTKDNDADFYRSNFFSTNNVDPASPDKFVMGPIWDFDRSAGAPPSGGTGISNTTGWWVRGNGSPNHNTNKIHWFTRIAKDPRFLAAIEARWAEKRHEYKDVALTRVDAAAAAVSSTAANNDRARWKGYGTRYAAKSSSWSGEISWVKKWYRDRYNWMDSQLSPAGSRDPIS